MYHVYALYNKKHNRIYIGQTKDLVKRLGIHWSKLFKNSYTARFDGKWELVYKERQLDRQEALKRERYLKSHIGRDYLRKILGP